MRKRRLIAYRQRLAPQHSGLGLESIEAWPAAGGGLLVGLAEPALAGAAALRPAVKTAFIRIDGGGGIALLLPYVALDDDARVCLRTLVAAELGVPEWRIDISDQDPGNPMVDIGDDAQCSLQACAAVARALLVAAAAEIWNLSEARCEAVQGTVRGPAHAIGYGDIAADAALSGIPDGVRLRCGRRLSVSAAARPVQDALA